MDMETTTTITHNLKDLTDHEMSAIQAGLILLANSAAAGNIQYPEYKRTAGKMLGLLKVNGYSYGSNNNSKTT